jgi:hypothetical protein
MCNCRRSVCSQIAEIAILAKPVFSGVCEGITRLNEKSGFKTFSRFFSSQVLRKRGFIRYVRSSAKRDEFGDNIPLLGWCQAREFVAKIARFAPYPKGNIMF